MQHTAQIIVHPSGDNAIAPAASLDLATFPVANVVDGVAFFVKVSGGTGTVCDLVVSASSNGTDYTVLAAKRFSVGTKMQAGRNYAQMVSAVTTGYIHVTDLEVGDVLVVYVPFDILSDTTTHLKISGHNGGANAINLAAVGVGDGVSYT